MSTLLVARVSRQNPSGLDIRTEQLDQDGQARRVTGYTVVSVTKPQHLYEGDTRIRSSVSSS